MANANHIPVVKFHKRKYGEELLIDIVTLETIRRSKHFTGVQRQSFYGIMLTTAGEANVEVDGHPCIAKKVWWLVCVQVMSAQCSTTTVSTPLS